TVEREGEALVGLREGEPHVGGAARPVEIARRDEEAALGEAAGDRPPALGRLGAPQPQIEGRRSAVVYKAERAQRVERVRPATGVPGPLLVDMEVVAERGGGGGLHGRRRHQTGVLANLAEGPDEPGLAGDAPAPPARPVPPLPPRPPRHRPLPPLP